MLCLNLKLNPLMLFIKSVKNSMAKYQIYAVGAAMVDTGDLQDEFLANHAIEKGVMTLEQSRQAQLQV